MYCRKRTQTHVAPLAYLKLVNGQGVEKLVADEDSRIYERLVGMSCVWTSFYTWVLSWELCNVRKPMDGLAIGCH